jgi:deoxyribodipyrimidine photo-lyase
MKTALLWFRRDLRLEDNTALTAAAKWAEAVVPIYIIDPAILSAPDMSAVRAAFILDSIAELEKRLADTGSRLIVRRGGVAAEMKKLLRESGATALFFNRAYEPAERERDAAVEKLARELGVEVQTFKDSVLFEPGEVLKTDGTPYRVYSPYRRVWEKQGRLAVVKGGSLHADPMLKRLKGEPLPDLKSLGHTLAVPKIPAGEAAARASLKRFCAGAAGEYATGRDRVALDGTSRLSPHLAAGTISPRTVLQEVGHVARRRPAAKRSVDVYVSELIWRDFYRQILWHFPHAAKSAFKPKYDAVPWENNERLFKAWCDGRTGYPIVDAAMRQLNTIGWMHNRARMIVSSFLSKDLLVSWQWGERYFMERLVDGDLAANNGGWQWSSGTGTDPQPYFRIFNPAAQAKKFDPEGRYIHKYIPEIDTRDYPAPIVDHSQQRVRALALYRKAIG